MKIYIRAAFICIICLFFPFSSMMYAQHDYVPPAGDWEYIYPEVAGFLPGKLNDLSQFAMDNENSVERDLRLAILKAFSREPYHELAGPVKERGGPAGLIIKDGYIAAQWGDTERVDMTFSVTKSYLSTVAGLA